MKRPLVLLMILLFGCKEVSFREPQPRGKRPLHVLPEKLQGKYLTVQDNGELSRDTVVITDSGYRFGYFDRVADSGRDDYNSGIISDTLVVKFYRGYYFINFFEHPEWVVRVIRQERNGDLIYMALEEDDVDFTDYVRKLSGEIRVDSVRGNNETLYYIDPSPPELIDLIEKGFFSRVKLKKIE